MIWFIRVIYSPNFSPGILNRLKWFQMLSLFRTIQQNVCCFEKREGWGTEKRKKGKIKAWMVWFATFEFYCQIGMGQEKSLFLFSEREFHLQSRFWCECLPKLRCRLHVYSNTKQQKASFYASETLSRKCLCTRTSTGRQFHYRIQARLHGDFSPCSSRDYFILGAAGHARHFKRK